MGEKFWRRRGGGRGGRPVAEQRMAKSGFGVVLLGEALDEMPEAEPEARKSFLASGCSELIENGLRRFWESELPPPEKPHLGHGGVWFITSWF